MTENDFPTDIGNILVRMGACSWDELYRAVEVQKSNPGRKLGEILIEIGVLTPPMLVEALELQENLRNTKGNATGSLMTILDRAVDAYRNTQLQLASSLDRHKER